VQAIAGKVKRLRRIGFIETAENILNIFPEVRSYPTGVVVFVQSFEAAMLEAFDQTLS
jgi:hypothetical protein